MTWATPWIAGIAAAVAVPTLLILYFLKLRRREVEISSTFLWKKSVQDLQANAPFQRLRRNILLLLQLLILAAALVGIARPEMVGDTPLGQKHLILIDRSASMGAVDARNAAGETVSRLEAAREQALALVDTLREPGFLAADKADEAMVIEFDNSAEVRQTFTSDKDSLRNAIRAIVPSDAPTAGVEAFQLARAHAPTRSIVETDAEGRQRVYALPPGPVGTIHLWSDGRLPDAERITPHPDDEVIYHAVGAPDSANLAITGLRAGRAFDDPNRLSIFVGLQNSGRAARSVDVELLIDGAVAGIKAADVPGATPSAGVVSAGGTSPPTAAPGAPGVGGVVFALDRPQGGIIGVRLADRSGRENVLAVDDQASLVTPAAKRLRVAVVTRDDVFISLALEGLPLAELRTLTPEEYGAMRADETGSGPFDVVVLDGWLPPPPEGADATLPPGRYLIFDAVPPPPWGALEHGAGGAAVILDWSRDHPALRGLTLDSLVIAKTRSVEVPRGSAATVLASADTGPAILEMAGVGTRAIVVPFDVMETSWPVDVSFVVFLAAALNYLGDDQAGLGPAVLPGEVLRERLPPDATAIRLRKPDGTETSHIPGPDGWTNFGVVRRAGVYYARWTGRPGPTDWELDGAPARPIAVNLLDPRESDVGTIQNLALGTDTVRAVEEQRGKVTRQLWPWLLLAALGVMLLEWYVYNRKVQV